jgi:MoxR-like ATPase
MSVLQSVAKLEKFSSVPSSEVEQELAGVLVDLGGGARLEHVSATVGKRLQELVKRASASFEQRTLEVEAAVAGLASGVSVLLLGPPGTAKSAIARKVSSLCGLGGDGRYFEYLLTSHTMPEEIFGGPKLEDLAKGKVVRAVEGKLPRAEIAFLDELFRGGSHILNTLLTILNEKRFDAGAGLEHVPLLGVIAAANAGAAGE